MCFQTSFQMGLIQGPHSENHSATHTFTPSPWHALPLLSIYRDILSLLLWLPSTLLCVSSTSMLFMDIGLFYVFLYMYVCIHIHLFLLIVYNSTRQQLLLQRIASHSSNFCPRIFGADFWKQNGGIKGCIQTCFCQIESSCLRRACAILFSCNCVSTCFSMALPIQKAAKLSSIVL